MTDASLQFLLTKFDRVVTREWGLKERVDSDISDLRSELKMMMAFLKAHNEQEQHPQILVAVAQVRDIACDIEHLLGMVEFQRAKESVSSIGSLRRRYHTHSMTDPIEEVKQKLEGSKKIRERYPTIKNYSRASSSMLADHFPTRFAYLSLNETEIVGIEDDKEMIISWADENRGDSHHEVLFVTGMGGSGKTVLVKQVFDFVKGGFECHAWIRVSKNAALDIFLQKLLYQLDSSYQHRPSATVVDLTMEVRNFLQLKRYVIVLDDLWSNDVWESIKHALPSGNGSRIIITTRRGDIAYSLRDNSIRVHNVQPLSPEKAEQLFHKKAFPTSGSCPRGLLKWSNAILTKCEGLPLAITEIGKILSAREETESEWKKMHDSLVSELRRNARLSNIREVLMLSYDDLPDVLKYCFLFMNLFPADYPINTGNLIRQWIAEGCIEEQTGKELEDIGEEYVKELIERSLIQVSELDFDGRPKACRVHNIMHDIFLSKLQGEAFGIVCSSGEQSGNTWDRKPRRISIQVEEFNKPSFDQVPHACTLLVFNPRKAFLGLASLKLLKVLHVQGLNLRTFPEEIEELLLLRYLCLRNTSIKHVPDFIGKLRYLETLDLKQTRVTKLPKEIRNLEKLRHLLVYRYDLDVVFDTVKGFAISADIARLTNLQKLSFVTAHSHQKLIISRMRGSCGTIQMLRHLKKLRKLGIIGLSKKDGKGLCQTIQCLDNLYSINLTSMSEEILDIQEISHPPRLQRLYLKGKLERTPSWISKLHDLVRLRLKWSRLPSNCNPIEILEDLPNLLELQLLDAYTGNQMDFEAGKFKKLKILEFEQLDQLKWLIMMKDTLPCLEKIIIRRCNLLEEVPAGIENLNYLKELILCDMPVNFVNKIRRGGSMRHAVEHIPVILSYNNQQKEDLHA